MQNRVATCRLDMSLFTAEDAFCFMICFDMIVWFTLVELCSMFPASICIRGWLCHPCGELWHHTHANEFANVRSTFPKPYKILNPRNRKP